MIWRLQVLNKVRSFAWRASKNILPTKVNLCHGKVLDNQTCEACDAEAKSGGHVFWDCITAQEGWKVIGISFDAHSLSFPKFANFMWYLMHVRLHLFWRKSISGNDFTPHRVFGCAWKIKFSGKAFHLTVCFVALTRKLVYIFIFTSNHFQTHQTRKDRESERERRKKLAHSQSHRSTRSTHTKSLTPIHPQSLQAPPTVHPQSLLSSTHSSSSTHSPTSAKCRSTVSFLFQLIHFLVRRAHLRSTHSNLTSPHLQSTHLRSTSPQTHK